MPNLLKRIVALVLPVLLLQDPGLALLTAARVSSAASSSVGSESFAAQALSNGGTGFLHSLAVKAAIRLDKSIKGRARAGASAGPMTLIQISQFDLKNSAGTEVYVNNLNKALLEEEGLRIVAVYPSEDEVQRNRRPEKEIIVHQKVRPHALESDVDHYIDGWTFYRKIRRVILEEKSNRRTPVMHVHQIHHFGILLATLILQIQYAVPRVLTTHLSLPSDLPPFPRALRARVLLPILALGAHVAAISRASTHQFAQAVEFVTSGIDLRIFTRKEGQAEAFRNKFAQDGVSPDAALLFYAARINSTKGQKDLVTVARTLKDNAQRLADKGIKPQIVIMGEVQGAQQAQYLSELKDMIREQDVSDYICILGPGTQEDVRNGLAASSLLVFPTQIEGFPLISLEAQAMGVPIVAYNVPGVDESIVEGAGRLVPSGDVNAFAATVLTLLELPKADLAVMGAVGISFVSENYPIQQLAGTLLKLYHRISGTVPQDNLRSSDPDISGDGLGKDTAEPVPEDAYALVRSINFHIWTNLLGIMLCFTLLDVHGEGGPETLAGLLIIPTWAHPWFKHARRAFLPILHAAKDFAASLRAGQWAAIAVLILIFTGAHIGRMRQRRRRISDIRTRADALVVIPTVTSVDTLLRQFDEFQSGVRPGPRARIIPPGAFSQPADAMVLGNINVWDDITIAGRVIAKAQKSMSDADLWLLRNRIRRKIAQATAWMRQHDIAGSPPTIGVLKALGASLDKTLAHRESTSVLTPADKVMLDGAMEAAEDILLRIGKSAGLSSEEIERHARAVPGEYRWIHRDEPDPTDVQAVLSMRGPDGPRLTFQNLHAPDKLSLDAFPNPVTTIGGQRWTRADEGRLTVKDADGEALSQGYWVEYAYSPPNANAGANVHHSQSLGTSQMSLFGNQIYRRYFAGLETIFIGVVPMGLSAFYFFQAMGLWGGPTDLSRMAIYGALWYAGKKLYEVFFPWLHGLTRFKTRKDRKEFWASEDYRNKKAAARQIKRVFNIWFSVFAFLYLMDGFDLRAGLAIASLIWVLAHYTNDWLYQWDEYKLPGFRRPLPPFLRWLSGFFFFAWLGFAELSLAPEQPALKGPNPTEFLEGTQWAFAIPLYDKLSIWVLGQAVAPMLLQSGSFSLLSYLLAPAFHAPLGFVAYVQMIIVTVVLRMVQRYLGLLGPESINQFRERKGWKAWKEAWRARRRGEDKTFPVRSVTNSVSILWIFVYMYVHPSGWLALVLYGVVVNIPELLMNLGHTGIVGYKINQWKASIFSYREAVATYLANPYWAALPNDFLQGSDPDRVTPGVVEKILKTPLRSIKEAIKPMLGPYSEEGFRAPNFDPMRAQMQTIWFWALMEAAWHSLLDPDPTLDVYHYRAACDYALELLINSVSWIPDSRFMLWRQFAHGDLLQRRFTTLLPWVKKLIWVSAIPKIHEKSDLKKPEFSDFKGSIHMIYSDEGTYQLVDPIAAHIAEFVHLRLQSKNWTEEQSVPYTDLLRITINDILKTELNRHPVLVGGPVLVTWEISTSGFVINIIDAAPDHPSPYDYDMPKLPDLPHGFGIRVSATAVIDNHGAVTVRKNATEGERIGNKITIEGEFGPNHKEEHREESVDEGALTYQPSRGHRPPTYPPHSLSQGA